MLSRPGKQKTNNYNTCIAQYLTKERQPDNEIWSVNRIYIDKYCYIKINIFLQRQCRKWGREASPRPIFIFFKKNFNKVKASGLQVTFNIFRFLTWNTIKTNCIKLETFRPEICSMLIFKKRILGIVSPPHCAYDNLRKISLSDFLCFLR